MTGFANGVRAFLTAAVSAFLLWYMLGTLLPAIASEGSPAAKILPDLQNAYQLIAVLGLLALGTIMVYWHTTYILGYLAAAFILLNTGLVDISEVVITSIFALVVLFNRFGIFDLVSDVIA
ncbi:MAG: hypothetical protein WC350_05290 [Candidatus Micrarchaeia archaeon]|jgi:hypothetical protein